LPKRLDLLQAATTGQARSPVPLQPGTRRLPRAWAVRRHRQAHPFVRALRPEWEGVRQNRRGAKSARDTTIAPCLARAG
jgi:hypothetical protein